MDWIKKITVKWWFWIIATALFLSVVQILFRFEAPCKWLDAVWEAGDLISLVGTLVLGYVAILQTKRANDMADDANKTSRKLIELQEAEYTPVITIKNFAGVTKHGLHDVSEKVQSEMFIHEMRCTDGEVLVGYSISLLDPDCILTDKAYCRDYEIHLNYSGRFVVESFCVKEIHFVGNDFEKSFTIKNYADMSLSCDEDFTLFLFLCSNEDFLEENTMAHKYLTASCVIFDMEMKSITGKIYKETVKIKKLLVDEPSPKVDFKNAELLVSASYQVYNDEAKDSK